MIRDAHDGICFGLFPIASILFQMSSLYSYCITIHLCVHQSLEHTSLVVKDSELLDDGNKLGNEALVSWIFFEIVCPVLEGVELEAKAMSQAILFAESAVIYLFFSPWANTGFPNSAYGDFGRLTLRPSGELLIPPVTDLM